MQTRDHRYPVQATCRIRRADGGFVPVLVTDLNTGGCRLAPGSPRFREAEAVHIALGPLVPVSGVLRWRLEDGSAGIRFDHPIRAELLKNLLPWLRGIPACDAVAPPPAVCGSRQVCAI